MANQLETNTTTIESLITAINEMPDAIQIDATLTQAGKAADAKATGDAISGITLETLGVTATAAELNKMDGVTATTAELNYVDGVTSNIQTQLNAKVPTSRTVNGKALSANITLAASDVGAADSSHTQAASTITAGTFAGAVVAPRSSQTYSSYMLRNSRLATSDTNPSYNGEICWTYG